MRAFWIVSTHRCTILTSGLLVGKVFSRKIAHDAGLQRFVPKYGLHFFRKHSADATPGVAGRNRIVQGRVALFEVADPAVVG